MELFPGHSFVEFIYGLVYQKLRHFLQLYFFDQIIVYLDAESKLASMECSIAGLGCGACKRAGFHLKPLLVFS